MKKLVMVIACLLLLASAGAVGLSCSEDEAEDVVAKFLGAPNYGSPPLEVQFADQSTGEIDEWAWDFGDGETSTAQSPSHTYTAVGEYTVSLTVSGPDGSDTKTMADYIEVGAIVAGFTALPTSGIAPLEVQFTDASTGDVTGWAWDFGDGETSTVQSPSHTYASEGVYTVILEVTGSAGTDTEVKTNYIDAEPELYETEVTWRLASASPTGSLQADQLQAFADLVEQNSRGRMEVKVFPSGTLYGLEQIFDAVSMGAVDLGYTGVSYYFGKMPKTASMVTYCSVTTDNIELLVYIDEYLFGNMTWLQEELAANDVSKLIWGPLGSTDSFFNSPVTVPGDAAGLDIACSPGVTGIVGLLGATPNSMDLADFYLSCQTGLVDGWMLCPMEQYTEMQLYDVAPYFTHINLATVMSCLMYQPSFDALPEDLQEVVTEAAAEIQAQWVAAVNANNAAYLQQLEDEADCTVITLTEAQRDQWISTAFVPVFTGIMMNFLSADEQTEVLAAIESAKAAYAAL